LVVVRIFNLFLTCGFQFDLSLQLGKISMVANVLANNFFGLPINPLAVLQHIWAEAQL
jgi:hypothetical protein